jgi:hypothetical protein
MEDNKNNFPYRIKVKVGETEFEFQSPDKETFLYEGLKLLKHTFGRYQDKDI